MIRKHWKKIIAFLGGLFVSIFAIITLQTLKNSKKDKDKEKLIKKNDEILEGIKKREAERDKILSDIDDNIDKLANGTYDFD